MCVRPGQSRQLDDACCQLCRPPSAPINDFLSCAGMLVRGYFNGSTVAPESSILTVVSSAIAAMRTLLHLPYSATREAGDCGTIVRHRQIWTVVRRLSVHNTSHRLQEVNPRSLHYTYTSASI